LQVAALLEAAGGEEVADLVPVEVLV